MLQIIEEPNETATFERIIAYNFDSLNREFFLELIELRSNELSILKYKAIQFKYVSIDNQNEIMDLLAAKIIRAIALEVQNKPSRSQK